MTFSEYMQLRERAEAAVARWNTRAIDRDELLRIASELELAEKWCDQNGDYYTGLVSITESKLREWSDRIRKLAKREGTLMEVVDE